MDAREGCIITPQRAYPTRHGLSGKSGFTFMELVACLAIICTLVGLLFPVFARSRESARRTNCQSNMAQVIQGLHLYAQDYSGRFPPADHDWLPLLPQTKNTGIFMCPSEPQDSRRRFGVGTLAAGSGGQPASLPSSYQYRAGLANDDPADEVVAADWEPWHRGTIVLYLGGYVRWDQHARPILLTGAPRPGR
jgi:prepilin-type N-terminal cleavage/methylation domain-containing protein